MRTCCVCTKKKDRCEGFDTHECDKGPVWICWWCYFRQLKKDDK